MESILKFFVLYAPLVYFLLVIGFLFSVRRFFLARREGKDAIFGLEREMSQRRMIQAVTSVGIILFLGLAELILQAFLAPNLPASSVLPTTTLNPLSVSTQTLSPELATTVGEALQVSSPNEDTGCTPGQISISSPKPGEELRGQVTLIGTVDIQNFGFYKYEFASLNIDTWTTIQAGRELKQESELGRWDTSEIPAGDYLLRLVATDNQGNSMQPCVVPVRILGQ